MRIRDERHPVEHFTFPKALAISKLIVQDLSNIPHKSSFSADLSTRRHTRIGKDVDRYLIICVRTFMVCIYGMLLKIARAAQRSCSEASQPSEREQFLRVQPIQILFAMSIRDEGHPV